MIMVYELEVLQGRNWKRVSFPGEEAGLTPETEVIKAYLDDPWISKARINQVYVEESNPHPPKGEFLLFSRGERGQHKDV